MGSFRSSSPSYISETGNCHRLTLDVYTLGLQHLVDEIQSAETRSLRTNQRTAKLQSFTRKGSCKFTGQFLIHAEHIAYFTSAYTDVTRRYIHIRTQMTPQFQNKRLAETHDFRITLPARGEIRATFATAHRQRGQRILEGLLKAQELQDGQIDGGMETNTAFIRTNGVVELHTIPQVGLHLAFIVYPCHTESKDTVGLHQTLDNLGFLKLRMLVVDILYRKKHFTHGLQIL